MAAMETPFVEIHRSCGVPSMAAAPGRHIGIDPGSACGKLRSRRAAAWSEAGWGEPAQTFPDGPEEWVRHPGGRGHETLDPHGAGAGDEHSRAETDGEPGQNVAGIVHSERDPGERNERRSREEQCSGPSRERQD